MKGAERRIYITNRSTRYRVNKALLAKLVYHIYRRIKAKGIGELEIVLLDTPAMRAINTRYKGLKRSTDVLSFRTEHSKPQIFIGTVFISIDQALKNSRRFKSDLREEFVRYVVHGMLHLFGYTDYTAPDRARMSKKENGVLKYLCTKENLSKVLTPR